jgi:hypothetical protein
MMPHTILQTGHRVRYSSSPNLYKFVSHVLAFTFEFKVWRSPTTQSITLGTPLVGFLGYNTDSWRAR